MTIIMASDFTIRQAPYEWAKLARESFLSKLHDKTLEAEFHRGHETRIVVYGPSQVGKTTLILLLLGIYDDHHADVAATLRGGAPVGSSATKAPIMYHILDDDKFSLKIGTGTLEKHDSASLKKRLAVMRKEVNTGRGIQEIVHIGIPSKYSTTEADVLPHYKIIDLPGEGSRDGREREQTDALLHQFVRSADVVLLVNTANQLVWFEGIHDSGHASYWPWLLEEHILIVTRAMTDSSVLHIVRDPNCTRQDLIGYIKRELAKEFEKKKIVAPGIQPGCEGVHLYSIDYGDSRKGMSEELRILADRWVHEVIVDLRSRVQRCAARNHPLRRPFAVLHKAKLRSDRLSEDFEKTMGNLRLEREALEIEVGQLKMRRDGVRNEIKSLHVSQGRVPEEINKMMEEEREYSVRIHCDQKFSKYKEEIITEIHRVEARLLKCIDDAERICIETLTNVDFEHKPANIKQIAKKGRQRLDKKISKAIKNISEVKKYWIVDAVITTSKKLLRKPAPNKIRIIHMLAMCSIKDASAILVKTFEAMTEEFEAEYSTVIERTRRMEKLLINAINNRETKLFRIMENEDTQKAHYSRELANVKHDIRLFNNYPRVIRNAYLEQMRGLQSILVDPNSRPYKLLHAVRSLAIVFIEYRSINEWSNPNG